MELDARWIGFGAAALLLLYAQAGYPLLMWLASRLPGPHLPADGRLPGDDGLPDDGGLPGVTLIIPAFNEGQILDAKLRNALEINYPRELLSIVVASDGSEDETDAIAAGYADRGVLLRNAGVRRGKTANVNDAVASASSELVCMCDANVMFTPDAMRRMVRRLADLRVGAVTGDVRLASHESNFGEGESAYYALERVVQRGESKIGSVMGVDGGMYVIRRTLFQPLPSDTILDDFVVSMRVIRQGYRVVYEPSAVAHENGTPLASQEFRRRVRVSAGAMQSLKRGEWPPLWRPVELAQYASHKLLRWLGPLLLVVLLLCNGLLWTAHPVFQALFVAQLGFYGLALAAAVSLRVRETRLGGVAFYFVLSHLAIVVGLLKGLFNLQRVAWRRTERSASTAAQESSTSIC